MSLLVKLTISLSVGALCVYLALRRIDVAATFRVLGDVSATAILTYAATMVVTHFFRAWRWEYLLRPIGVSLPLRRLFPISSVGFMAILAVPLRLGELVRPYYVVRAGQSRMSAVLGTVAVERVVDGLLISLVFCGTFLASDPGSYSPILRASVWLSLIGFLTLTAFLASALRFTEGTIRMVIRLTMLDRWAPSLAVRAADKVRALIHGFRALRDAKNLVPFLFQTLLYWGSNGLGVWLLARQMHLDISLTAAYAIMAFTGVVISLPNSPGLVGQFHFGVVETLGAYLPAATVASYGGAYAIALHGIQFVWYVSLGLLSLFLIDARARTFRSVVVESKRADAGGGSGASG